MKLQWRNEGGGWWGLFVQDRSEWNQKTSQLFCEASWHQSEASFSVFFSDFCCCQVVMVGMVLGCAGICVHCKFAGVLLDSVGHCDLLIAFNICAPEMRDA